MPKIMPICYNYKKYLHIINNTYLLYIFSFFLKIIILK